MLMCVLAKCASQAKHLLILAAALTLLCLSTENSTAQEWKQLAPTGGPPSARIASSAVFDDSTNQMIVYGGGNCTDFGDTWSLTIDDGPRWTQLTPLGNLPPARAGQTAVYDSATSSMTIFGGGLGCSSPCSNDTWVLSNANSAAGSPAWTQLLPTGGPPIPRIFHTAVYDPGSNRMIVFGGNNCFTAGAAYYNDVWVLTNSNGSGGTPCGRSSIRLASNRRPARTMEPVSYTHLTLPTN